MRETFAEFEVRLQRIAQESFTEWQNAHNALLQFGGRASFDGRHFLRLPNGGRFLLALGDVCAYMEVPRTPVQPLGELPKYLIRFGRIPPGPGVEFSEEPPQMEEWFASPVIEGGVFLWALRRTGLAEPLKVNSAELADEVAKGLAEYYLQYVAANRS